METWNRVELRWPLKGETCKVPSCVGMLSSKHEQYHKIEEIQWENLSIISCHDPGRVFVVLRLETYAYFMGEKKHSAIKDFLYEKIFNELKKECANVEFIRLTEREVSFVNSNFGAWFDLQQDEKFYDYAIEIVTKIFQIIGIKDRDMIGKFRVLQEFLISENPEKYWIPLKYYLVNKYNLPRDKECLNLLENAFFKAIGG